MAAFFRAPGRPVRAAMTEAAADKYREELPEKRMEEAGKELQKATQTWVECSRAMDKLEMEAGVGAEQAATQAREGGAEQKAAADTLEKACTKTIVEARLRVTPDGVKLKLTTTKTWLEGAAQELKKAAWEATEKFMEEQTAEMRDAEDRAKQAGGEEQKKKNGGDGDLPMGWVQKVMDMWRTAE